MSEKKGNPAKFAYNVSDHTLAILENVTVAELKDAIELVSNLNNRELKVLASK